MAELLQRPVAGAFLSLKRGKHLRACCGLLGQPMALARALEHAAGQVAREDVRFPPISPSELAHLELEVWLLSNPQPVRVLGEERVKAVQVGRHGVQVMQGQSSGLFLPSVAVENNWDARRLLDQVCVKAGLPPTAWKEDTALLTFEGEVLHGRLAAPPDEEGAATDRWPGPCRPEDVSAHADFCRGNLLALLTGSIPNYYFVGASDGMVTGVVFRLHWQGASGTLDFNQFSFRPGLPLQSTLFTMTQWAAQRLTQGDLPPTFPRPIPAALSSLRVSLTLLHDPVLHGTVADPHLAGLDPRHRAILVLERHKSALRLDPAQTAEELLREAATQAQVTEPGSAAVFSLATTVGPLKAGLATDPVSISTVPRPVRGPAIRPPAAAGTFYEANPTELSRTVDRLLAGERRPEPWPAALLPHAGLPYSGTIAAAVLNRLQFPSTVIVIGPKHTTLGVDWAVAPHQTWALPFGSIESDFVLARQLCQAIPGLEMDAQAHQKEHAIEVELPLLARLAPQTRVVGIAIGHARREDCLRIAEGLAGLLRERQDRPLLLISSDMNHFASDAENRRLDALALAALEQLDPEALYETVTHNSISMCGVLPAVIVLETLRLLGSLSKAERVGYATTADVTGDRRRVVGYAGMLFG